MNSEDHANNSGQLVEDRLSVYYGREKFSPSQFESFEVGGLHYTTTIREYETPEQAFERAHGYLDKMVREQFRRKSRDFAHRRVMARIEVKGGEPNYEDYAN